MKQLQIGNFRVFILNAGLPNLERLGLEQTLYDIRCSRANRMLEARSCQVQYNGINNPYDERSQILEHQKFQLNIQTLPSNLEYFLEDEEEEKIMQLRDYLSARQ